MGSEFLSLIIAKSVYRSEILTYENYWKLRFYVVFPENYTGKFMDFYAKFISLNLANS